MEMNCRKIIFFQNDSFCTGKTASLYWNGPWPRTVAALQGRHNGRDGVSNHQPHDSLLNHLFGADQRKHQSSASLAFVRGIHRWLHLMMSSWFQTTGVRDYNRGGFKKMLYGCYDICGCYDLVIINVVKPVDDTHSNDALCSCWSC